MKNFLKRFSLTDSRGEESITLLFVALSWVVVWIKFILAGATLPVLDWKVPPMTATEFGVSISAIMAVWLGREWKAKDLLRGNKDGDK